MSQITTESSGVTLPGQGVFLVIEMMPGQGTKLTFDAPRATSFTLLHQAPGDGAFPVLADGLTARKAWSWRS